MPRRIDDVRWNELDPAARDRLGKQYLSGDYTPPGGYMLNSGSDSGGGSGGTGGGGSNTITNMAEEDPRLVQHANDVQDRITNFGAGTQRAIDLASSKARDAAEGRKRAIEAKYARLGTFGTEQQLQADLESDYETGRDIDQKAAEISVGRENDYDQFLLNSTGALAAPGQSAKADRALNLQQWEIEEGGRRADDAAALARQMALLNALNAVPQPPEYTGGPGSGYGDSPYGGGAGGGRPIYGAGLGGGRRGQVGSSIYF